VKMIVQRNDAYDLNHSFTFDIKNPPWKMTDAYKKLGFLEWIPVFSHDLYKI
jgi:hypothetical protein